MADIKTNQSKVFNALKSMGYSGIGNNETEFADLMAKPQNRQKVYNALSSRGYKGIGKDQAAFDSLIYQAQQPQQTQPVQQPQATQQAAPQTKPAQKHVKTVERPVKTYPTPEINAFDSRPNPMAWQRGNQWQAQPESEEPKEETFKEKIARNAKGELNDQEKKNVRGKMQQRMDEIDYENETGKRLRDRRFNAPWEAPTVERDDYGNIRHNDNGDVIRGFTTDEVRAEEHQRIMQEQNLADVTLTPEEQAYVRLQEANKEINAMENDYLAGQRDKGIFERVFEAYTPSVAGGAPQTFFNDYMKLQKGGVELQNRKRMLEYGLELAEDARKDAELFKDDDPWYKKVAKGLGRAYSKAAELRMSDWDFGRTESEKNIALFNAVVRADNGEATEDDMKLLNDFAVSQMLEQQSELSGWTKAGMVTRESLPFMLEMVVTNGGAFGSKMGEQYLKYAVKKYGTKYVRDHIKSVLAKKVATRLAGDLVAAHTMAGTTGAMRTMANAYERMRGDVRTGVDAEGNIIYDGHEVGDSAFDAFSKAWRSQAIENWSEMAGEYLPVITGFFGNAVGKAVIGKAGREALKLTGNIENVGLNKVQKFIYDLAAKKGIGAMSKGVNDFLKRTQWHGVLGEYSEEVLGNLADALTVGDMTLDTAEGTGVFNLQQNIDTFCGVALMGGFTSALQTGGYGIDRYRNSVGRRDRQGAEAFGNDWERVKTAIDSSVDDSRELNNVLTDFLGSDMVDQNQKKAILNYTSAVLQDKGAEMSQFQPRMNDSKIDEVVTPDGKKYVVTSQDKNGDTIEQQVFDTEDDAKAYEGELKMKQQHQDFDEYFKMSQKPSVAESESMVNEFLARNGYNEADELRKSVMMAAISDPSTEFGKRFQQFRVEKTMQKARASQAAIAAFEEQQGWTPGTVRWLTEQDPMQLDDEGLQMADQASEFLEGLAYPSTEVHVEHEQQKGVEAAQQVIEQMESPDVAIDPLDNQGQLIADQYENAKQSYDQLLSNNEELAQEINSRMGTFSEQEIVSSLESFTPDEVQTVIDFFNAQARWQSFKEEAAKQIDNVAHRNRERNTFQGTINGQPDKNNLIVITDGTNQLTLVSGNITVNERGQITDSFSGLIIGIDDLGNFVQISDTSGYLMIPPSMTLDQFEEAERQRLQERATAVINPSGSMTQATEQGGTVGGEAGVANNTGANEPPATALSKIPVDEKGQPIYTQASPEDAYNALVEQVGEQGAATIAQSELNDARNRLEKLTKDLTEGEVKGKTAQEKVDMIKQKQQAIQIEQTNIAHWEKVLNVPVERKKNTPPPPPPAPVVTAKQFIDRMEAAGNVEEMDAIYQEGLAAGIAEAELMPTYQKMLQQFADNVPEYRYDTPEAARKRGYKIVEGQRIDRQEEKPMPQGMVVEVQYSTKDKVKGRLTVSELGEVQGSHLVNGQRNQKNFIPEAQPKAEFGADRQAAAQTNASEANFRPELMLTFNGTQSAYSGSTTQTNLRGEVIQGNGRRNLAEFIYAPGNEKVAQRYKEFLMAHAEELGTTAEAIAQMEKPFAHIVLDVTDEEAIRLGQFTAADLETGGKKIPEVASTATKLGDKFSSLANIVLRHEDPDASLAERIEANADDAVRWLNQGGYINNTEAKTLLEDKAAARQFIKDLLTDTLFSGAAPELRTMFYELPKNIQSAIVSVVGREVTTNPNTTILKDIQESIIAYHELVVSSPQFAGVKGRGFEERYRAATAAVNDWLRQINIDGSLNKDKFSNFALELAKLYRCLTDQKTLANRLRDYYDLVSGATRQLGMFDEPGTTGVKTREEAIKQIFGIDYGRQGTVPLASNNQGSQEGGEGSTDSAPGGERDEDEGGPSDTGGGDTGDAPEGVDQNPPSPPTPPTPPAANNTPLTPEEIDGSSFPKQAKTLAKAYLNGNHGELQTQAYEDIYEEVRGSLPATPAEPAEPTAPAAPQQPVASTDPIEAINQAAAAFRAEQNQQPAAPAEPQGETMEQKRARLKAEILAKAEALKKAQIKNMREDMGKMGMNRLTPSFIPRDKEQRKMFWDLVQTTAEYGYTYIQEGVTDFKEWSKRISEDIVDAMRDIFQWWGQKQADDYIDAVWNSEVEADGKTQTLAEFAAEKQNNANVGDNTVNEHKKEDNEVEKPVSLQQEAKPTTKQGWLNKIEEVFEELCKKYGVPTEPIIFAGNTQRYGFDYRITKGYQLDQFEPYYDAYKKKLDEEVEPATEKQLKYIERLVADDSEAKKILDGVKLNKISASYVIAILKASEDAVYSRNTTADVFDEYYNELTKVAKLAGKEFLEGDSAEFARKQKQTESLRKRIAKALEDVVFRDGGRLTLLNFKAMAKQEGIADISDTDLQELVEAEIVNLARDIANTDALNDEQKFAHIVKLYQKQPSLNARDNDRINLQQYSTPAPMAFLMGKFLTAGKEVKSGLEPSAGNGMLTLALPKEVMHVNDIDEMRLANLGKQGFANVTSQDGLQSFGEKQYDVVVTNPPFGNVPAKTYDGLYEISGLEHQMAINALESMKDDGRAAIIIGGNTEYNQNGTIKGKDRAFLNYLYAHYNVLDVINMNGHELYSRQGTGFPVRMILINGRKEFNPRSFAPVIQKARAERVNSYDELYKRVNDDILSDTNKPASVHDTASGESRRVDDTSNAGNTTQTGVRAGGTQVRSGENQFGSTGGQRIQGGNSRTNQGTNTQGDTNVGGGLFDVGSGANTSQSSGSTSSQADQGGLGDNGGNSTQRPTGVVDSTIGGGSRRTRTAQQDNGVQRELGTEKVPYRQQSTNPFSLQSQMPAEQAEVVKKALEDLGDVDQFLVDELGYGSIEELHHALAAEQIDSVALAIHQMKNGDAFIIGDQTGIGKGRQGAALIRWAVKNGTPPVYFTAKPELFSSVYRDIKDIGSDGLRPFILASDKTKARIVEEKDGKQTVLYDLPSDKEQKRVLEYINKNGKLPPEYDFMITTYSQVGNGTMEYENGQKKPRNYGKNKKATTADYNGQAKRDAIETLAASSVAIMDESHLAGGDSARGNYLQYVSTKAKGITYISATFAKRPDNMPLYSLRTAISKAGVKVSELIDAVKRGGATFQEIMSKALTEAGQMIRRERDMTGVTVDWKGIEDEEVIKKHYEQYDTVIGLFNDIIQFQRAYVDPIVNKMNDDAADEQGEVEHTPGTRDMGINNTPFASRTHQIVKQVLLSLKAAEGAKFAIECLKNGEKPVITLENTNEGAADKATGGSEEDMEMPDLSVNLKQGLQGTLRVTKKDAFGNSVNEMIPFDRLSEAGQARFREIMDAIENASTGLSLSPIDVIKHELKKAGYSVAELTGRKKEFVYNEDGTVKRVNRTDTDNKKNASDFNNGRVDALILNKSAGTGIDLHASTKFDDQRQRHMIVVQAQSDINDEVQVRGRTDRTGQKQHSKYTYIVSTIPSEQRLLMMLKAKLRSLDANTTSSQKSKFNEMQVQDIINKYGDEIVIQYLAEHPDLAMKMCDPLKWGEGAETLSPETLISQAQKPTNGGDGATASKVLGRMALLTVKEQEKMLAEIGDLYSAEIDRLNEMGENDLEITEMPLKAKTLKKDVWEEGVEPGGKNPFADNSYVETVVMDVLKKPMKAEEVKKAQERLLGGKTWEEYKQETLSKVEEWAANKKEEIRKAITERAEKKANAEKEKYIKGAKKAQEKNGFTDEQIEKYGQMQYDTFFNQEMEKLNNALEAVDKQMQAFVDALETFSTDGVYALPTDIYDLSQLTFEPSFGKVIDINIKEDNYSTAASTITFATLDGRRKITIPISGMVKQHNGEKQNIVPAITSQTAQSRDGFFGRNLADMYKVLSQNLDNWDRLTSTATRKKGYIITGNLLKALTELRKQGKGGKLISYTTDTGDVRQGILMSDQFDPNTLTSKNPISSAKEDLFDWSKDRKVTSADGDVEIRNDGGGWFQLKVPKSKKKGEKYFNDQTLLDLVSGQFEGSSRMAADFRQDNLDAILKRLDELGVTVASTKEEQEGVNASDPMDAINQAANSWRRSVKESESSLSQSSQVAESENKSVPLERRTMKSYTDRKGVYHEGIEDELARIESEISAAVNQGDNQDVLESQQEASARPRVNDLRKQAAKLRAEIARRNQKKQELRKKYNIDERGNISLDDLVRMFRDLNSNKAVGKLFDKVVKVLKKLNVSYRFTDNLDAMTAGEAGAFYNTTFYNWDVLVRDGKDQTKAGDLLHEMIHNVAEHILMRYENPALQDIFGKLSPELDKAAQEIKAIFKAVRAAKLKKPNGKPYYGSTFASEMIAELADEDFRKALDTVAYNRDKENSHRTAWQAIKEWFRKLFGVNTALDSLGDVLDNILDSYSPANVRTYNREREIMEQRTIDEGRTGDYMDYLEAEAINGRASLVEDADLIERLEKEPKIKVYRAMQLQDGKLYPPMAAKVNGQWQDPLPLGKWSQADEHPELVDKNGKFTLDKGNGKTVAGVVYAPYMHGSTTMLNDQFKEAQDRPELVVVEAEMPESELTSGYQAEKSPRKTGRLPWKAGTIQGQLTGMRDVILSRWVKPVRIVPASEVAQSIKQMIDGQVEIMPTNVVTPEQREELEKLGVKFVKTNNQEIVQEGEHKGEQYSDAYGKKSKKSKAKRKKSVDGDPLEAISRSAAAWRKSVADDEGMTPEAHSAKAIYDERLNRVETVFSEAYQDAMVSLKTAQNAIAKDKDIPDSQNAYMAENLMHGKNKNEMDLYNREKRDPLIRTINKIMNLTRMNWGDVDRYVYTKSGLERNREFFIRDWLEVERNKTIRRYEDLNDAEQAIYERMENSIVTQFEDGDITEEQRDKKLAQALQNAHNEYVNQIEQEYLNIKSEKFEDMQYGMITFPEYLEAIDNFIRRTIDYGYEPSEHDYSGFRAMFGDEDGKYDEADIIDEMMNTEGMMEAENVDTLWEQIREATRYGLERYREAGMRSDEQIDQIEQMFHFYVPMRGFKAETGEDMYQYFTGKAKAKSYVGGLLKHAKGRGSEANYPISTIFAMTYKAISDCNQNLVNQKFYRLCQANPNDLVILSDSWAVLNERTGEWEEVAPDIPEEATEDEVREITLAWEEEMKELAKDGKAKKIKGKEHFDYKPMDKRNQSEHIVDVRINGQPRKMIVTGNPRMAQALNGQLRFEHGKNVFSRWNAAIKNYMASVFTSYSPTFALRNIFRDWTHFRTMLSVREGEGYANQASKYYRQSLFKMVGLFKKYREDTLDMNNEMEADFKDFMDNGGITGFVQMMKVDEIQQQMEKLNKMQKEGKPIQLNNKLWDYTLGAIEAINEGIENNARFATFRASRHYAGRSKARSAYDAKEITVNFNRKGAGGKTAGFKSQSKMVEDTAKAFGVTSQILGEGRIFFNATVQAIATTFKNFQNPDGSLNRPYIAKWAAKYALPPFMLGLALPYINKMLAMSLGGGDDGDDDPYANLAEWTRRRNICIYIGKGNFLTMPIGQELAAFLALGDMFAGMTYAPDLKPVDRSFDEEMLGILNTFSPVDVDTKVTKGGLKEDPLSEVVGRSFSVLAPIVAVEQNLGWTGRPIYREDTYPSDKYNPEYQMVYNGTNPVLVGASKLANDLSGGDDVARGKIQVNPAIVQYLWEQYTGGPGKVFSNTISIGKDAKDLLTGNDNDFNIRKVEGLKAFVQQGDDRTAYYRTLAKYRKYKADADELSDKFSGYKKSADDNPEALLKLEKLVKSEDFVRMRIVNEADKSLSKINKAANQAEGKQRKELRQLYNRQVKMVVDLLDQVGQE